MMTRFCALSALVVAYATGAQAQDVHWGKHPKITPDFKTKVIAVAKALGTEASYLMTVMSIETSKVVDGKPEPTFDPASENPTSKAVGLIQFTATTAASLGTTAAKLKAMSAVEQLDWVQKYFQPYKGKLTSVENTYFAVFYPALMGKPDSDTLPQAFYAANKGFDKNNDGKITRGEIADYVKKRHEVGAILKG